VRRELVVEGAVNMKIEKRNSTLKTAKKQISHSPTPARVFNQIIRLGEKKEILSAINKIT